MHKIKVYSKPTDNMLSNLYKNYTNLCMYYIGPYNVWLITYK